MENNEMLTSEQIEREIGRLQLWLHVVKQKEIAEHKQKSAVHIGRCFKSDRGQYVMIVDVPQEKEIVTGIDYSPYQYPALWLNNELIPFELKPVFSGIFQGKIGKSAFEEITSEEFIKSFDKCLQSLRDMVEQKIANRTQETENRGDLNDLCDVRHPRQQPPV